MILDAEIVKQIQGHRRTMVRLPVEYRAVWLEADQTTTCPYKPGKAYKVKISQKAQPSCEITIDSIEDAIFDDKPVWVIRFKLGNHTDEDRYPAARPGGAEGDYTSVPSRKLNGTGAEVSAHELSRYALTAHESHENGLQERRERLLKAISELRLEAAKNGVDAPRALKLLKSAESELSRRRAIQRAL